MLQEKRGIFQVGETLNVNTEERNKYQLCDDSLGEMEVCVTYMYSYKVIHGKAKMLSHGACKGFIG